MGTVKNKFASAQQAKAKAEQLANAELNVCFCAAARRSAKKSCPRGPKMLRTLEIPKFQTSEIQQFIRDNGHFNVKIDH